jgi:hypothetical protein
MKFRALKECPQGQIPGEIFEATEDAGAVLESVGAAERVVDEPEPKKGKGQYKRRDLVAEDPR